MNHPAVKKYWKLAVPLALILSGAAIGLVLSLVLGGGGDGSSAQPSSEVCARGVSGAQYGTVGAAQFDKADAGLTTVLTEAGQGNVDAARNTFYIDVHNFTHALDGPLRPKDPNLATNLCRAVVQIESEFLFQTDPATIAAHAKGIQEMLKQARTEVGPLS